MRVATLLSITTVLIFALACTPSGESFLPAPAEEAANPESERLRLIVEQLQAEHGIPGLSVVIAETGKKPVIAVAGFSDLKRQTPVTPDTMFFLGSVAKNLFATVTLRLVEQGRLDLENPISDFIEWPRGDEVTIRMLLTHTSGIPDYMTGELFETAEDGGIPEFFRTSRTPAELMAAISDRSLIFDPGSQQDYSNTNGLLVGEVIRQVTVKSLAETLDDQIVHLIGLKQMYLFGTSTGHRDRAAGYSGGENWGAVDGKLVDCSAADEALPDSGDGSVVASAGDLLRYHQALREGELLSDSSWAAMRTAQPGFHNGLGYLLAEGPFGRVEGNLGRSMGHIAANLYYFDLGAYVVMLSNRSDVPLPLEPLLRQWFGEEE